MSGGHYDYLYFKIEEAGEEITHQKDHQEIRQIISKILNDLSKIMYEVEWEDSGDGGDWQEVNKSLKELFDVTDFDLERIKKVKKYEMITEIITQLPK